MNTKHRLKQERDDDDEDLFNQNKGYFERTQVSNTITFYFDEEIGAPSEYRQIIQRIHNLTTNDTLELVLNTPGGRLDTTINLVNAIKSTDAEVIGILDGKAASAGSMILLSCPNVMVMPNSTVMIHTWSGGFGGKSHEIMANNSFYDAEIKKLMADVYLGFLTEKELGNVFNGSDLYFNSDEVIERLKQRSKWLERTKKKVEAEQNPAPKPRKPKAVAEPDYDPSEVAFTKSTTTEASPKKKK